MTVDVVDFQAVDNLKSDGYTTKCVWGHTNSLVLDFIK